MIGEPGADAVDEALSLHVLGFSSHGELLVAESDGAFDIDTWEQVYDKAEDRCRGSNAGGSDETGDIDMESTDQDSLERAFRRAVEEKSVREHRWKEGLR